MALKVYDIWYNHLLDENASTRTRHKRVVSGSVSRARQFLRNNCANGLGVKHNPVFIKGIHCVCEDWIGSSIQNASLPKPNPFLAFTL
jgi:hypothetical protein